MNLLILNTCLPESLVAVSLDGAIRASTMLPARATTEQLIPAIAALLEGDRPGAIAVVSGPGSFTGIRAGLSAAKGLCEAWNVPLLAISRLELLASAVESDAEVVALLDAGRGEYYCGVYTANTLGGRTKLDEQLLRLDQIQPLLDSRLAVTSDPRVAETFAGAVQLGEAMKLIDEPGAAAVLAIAHDRILHQQWSDVALTDANYLRRTDAELLERQAAHRRNP
jgi:tRNA threonylcarbamoyladenosine biosynthesis protein TsaB